EHNISFQLAANWTNFLLEEELESGLFADPSTYPALPEGIVWPTGRVYTGNFGPPIPPELVDPDLEPNQATGTYLDRIVDLLHSMDVLAQNAGPAAVKTAAEAAVTMNIAIVDAIRATGVAADGVISRPDVFAINAWLLDQPDLDWQALRSPDGGFDEIVGFREGFTFIFGEPAVRTVLDGFYDLGFAFEDDRLTDRTGDDSIGVGKARYWLGAFLEDELTNGFFANDSLLL
ncbi:MAG: hypothetical protein ACOC3D_13320, partial [Pseudomonadota bacterium]